MQTIYNFTTSWQAVMRVFFSRRPKNVTKLYSTFHFANISIIGFSRSVLTVEPCNQLSPSTDVVIASLGGLTYGKVPKSFGNTAPLPSKKHTHTQKEEP